MPMVKLHCLSVSETLERIASKFVLKSTALDRHVLETIFTISGVLAFLTLSTKLNSPLEFLSSLIQNFNWL